MWIDEKYKTQKIKNIFFRYYNYLWLFFENKIYRSLYRRATVEVESLFMTSLAWIARQRCRARPRKFIWSSVLKKDIRSKIILIKKIREIIASYKVLCDIKWIVGNMEDLSQDWDSGSDMAESPSPSISSQASMITSNGTKKAINRGRWTKEEVRLRLFKIIKRFSFNIYLILTNLWQIFRMKN